jgi:hypothetical protein
MFVYHVLFQTFRNSSRNVCTLNRSAIVFRNVRQRLGSAWRETSRGLQFMSSRLGRPLLPPTGPHFCRTRMPGSTRTGKPHPRQCRQDMTRWRHCWRHVCFNKHICYLSFAQGHSVRYVELRRLFLQSDQDQDARSVVTHTLRLLLASPVGSLTMSEST